MEYTQRIAALQKILNPFDAALITSEANRRYVTGFPSSDGLVVITKTGAFFLIDSRYHEKAKREVGDCEVLLLESAVKQLNTLFSENGIREVLVECEQLSLARFQAYKKKFQNVRFCEDNRLDVCLKGLRAVKSPAEIAAVKAAQKLTDETFSAILPRIAPGRTEKEIMLEMEFYMRKAGSEGVSFDFIVVSGKNSSLPHGVPTDKTIEPGDFITMDFGAVVNGYRSDMTRTVGVGSVSEEQRMVYETVLAAQKKAMAAIKPGARCCDIDKIARDLIDSGYPGCFGHGLGHSVGLEIHESPTFSPRCTEKLQPGMIITVEPGIYLENRFGVRIEDMIVVTESGCETLTKSSKELIVL